VIEQSEKGINVYIYQDRNSPETMARLQDEIRKANTTGESNLVVPVPILARKRDVAIGYLTCAYLMWFKQLGYSFALQSHLDPIRAQILDVKGQLIPETYVGAVNKPFESPWISFGYIDGAPVLVSGIVDHVIAIPAFNKPNVLSGLKAGPEGWTITNRIPSPVSVENRAAPPFGVILDDLLFVMPDALTRDPKRGPIFRIRRDGKPPDVLGVVSEDEFERLKQGPHEFKHIRAQDLSP
jgi:hypothetical protein